MTAVIGNLIVIAVLVLLVALAIRTLLKGDGGCSSCGGNCAGCRGCHNVPKKTGFSGRKHV